MFFPPFLAFFVFIFIFLLLVAFGLIQFGLFSWAFSKIGIPPVYLFTLLFLCIAGSMINIPLRRIPLEKMLTTGTPSPSSECVSILHVPIGQMKWYWR